MLSVQTNVSAISATRHLAATNNALGTAMERLSSGFRINRAADDAAGLAVSEKLKAQIGGLNQASVEQIALHHHAGMSFSRCGARGRTEVEPVDLALADSAHQRSRTVERNLAFIFAVMPASSGAGSWA